MEVSTNYRDTQMEVPEQSSYPHPTGYLCHSWLLSLSSGGQIRTILQGLKGNYFCLRQNESIQSQQGDTCEYTYTKDKGQMNVCFSTLGVKNVFNDKSFQKHSSKGNTDGIILTVNTYSFKSTMHYFGVIIQNIFVFPNSCPCLNGLFNGFEEYVSYHIHLI